MTRSAESRTYRATPEAWLGQMLLPVVFFYLLTVTAIDAIGLDPLVGGIGVGGVVLLALFEYVLPMLRNYMVLDVRSIEGSFNGRSFQVYWTEILAAWVFKRGGRRFLCLGTRTGTLVLPLRFMNERAVWEHVKRAAPPAALAEGAVERLPDYKQWDTARAQVLDNAEPSTVSDHWMVQVLGWAGLTFFLFCATDALRDGLYLEVALNAGMFFVSANAVTRWGITHFNDCAVERITFFGSFRIGWDEVRHIELDPFDTVVVLEGDDCRLVIPGPGVWAGGNRRKALAMMLAQAEKRGIPLRRSLWAALRSSRNTRARR